MAKTRSFGVKAYINGVLIGGLTEGNKTGATVTEVDTTTHDSSGGYREFEPGLKDGGTLNLSGLYDYSDAGQAAFVAAEGTLADFYLIFPDNSGFAFKAVIGGYEVTSELDGAVQFTATAKVSKEVLPVFPTITVTGTLNDGVDPVVFPALLFAGVDNGFARIAYTSSGIAPGSFTNGYSLYYDEGWVLDKIVSSSVTARWTAAATGLLPQNATPWIPDSPATGTPVLTGS